ncbi:hypothetical protein V1478_017836 [Vespula squamosa]|uniref:Uncharacterized protein n=1 Tax=Vespula squamosa TaxID=30214 RepID=A0ABD1ZVD9_VESSQ
MRSGRGGVCLSATVISNRKRKSKKVSAREVEVTRKLKKKKKKRRTTRIVLRKGYENVQWRESRKH